MKALNTPSPELAIDRTRPIIKFSPWPFQDSSIVVEDVYLYTKTDLGGPYGPYETETLTQDSWDVLGYMTDGRPFLTREDDLS